MGTVVVVVVEVVVVDVGVGTNDDGTAVVDVVIAGM